MHLIIPYAASQAFSGTTAWADLPLPNLQALLSLLQPQPVVRDPEDTPLLMPHERLLARALGLPALDNSHPTPSRQAWMTPCHWQIGMDQVVMLDPARLALTDDESQQLLQAMQAYLDGLEVHWHSALHWRVQGEMLAEVRTASLDRVIGQNVKLWMPDTPAARPWRRLQSEMQMLLYNHPVNNAREARRQLTVNAFWLHSAGPQPPHGNLTTPHASAGQIKMADDLRSSALRGDLEAWRRAWQALDATAVAELLVHAKTTGQACLSLCSESATQTYPSAPRAWHQRLVQLIHKNTPAKALQALIAP